MKLFTGRRIWLKEFPETGEPRQEAVVVDVDREHELVLCCLVQFKLKDGDDGLREVPFDQIEE